MIILLPFLGMSIFLIAYYSLSTANMQLPLLKERWKTILFGAAFQYVHGVFSQLAHRMHRPLPQPLHDVGFALLPVWSLCNLNILWDGGC
jgi:hypothetical protein